MVVWLIHFDYTHLIRDRLATTTTNQAVLAGRGKEVPGHEYSLFYSCGKLESCWQS